MFSERTLNCYGLDWFGGFFVKNLTFWNPFRAKFNQFEGVQDPHQFQTMGSSGDDSALTIAVISKSISLKDSTKSELFKIN